jgi:transcriptional pleiotropic regulator of transition state genes
MKSTGIIRKVDELGRVVLPVEIRRNLDIADRDELEIYIENDRVILQKYEPSCVFCGSVFDLVNYKGKNTCTHCINEMKKHI